MKVSVVGALAAGVLLLGLSGVSNAGPPSDARCVGVLAVAAAQGDGLAEEIGFLLSQCDIEPPGLFARALASESGNLEDCILALIGLLEEFGCLEDD